MLFNFHILQIPRRHQQRRRWIPRGTTQESFPCLKPTSGLRKRNKVKSDESLKQKRKVDHEAADSLWGSMLLGWSGTHRRTLQIHLVSAVQLGLGPPRPLEPFTAAQHAGTRKGGSEILTRSFWLAHILGFVLTRTPEQPEKQPSRHRGSKGRTTEEGRLAEDPRHKLLAAETLPTIMPHATLPNTKLHPGRYKKHFVTMDLARMTRWVQLRVFNEQSGWKMLT